MKCPNPLCGNIIPDDSKFCPDCGTKIEDIDKIRKECKSFVDAHRQGYTKALEEGRIPQFSEYLSLDGYKKILSSTLVVKYQQEYDHEQSEERKREKRAQEELKHCRDEVHKIYTHNRLGYKSLAKHGKFASYCDDFTLGQCHRVLRYREEILKEQKRLEEERRILNALRKEVEEFIDKHKEGYRYARKHINIPLYYSDLPIEQCQEILNHKDYIIQIEEKIHKKEKGGDLIFELLFPCFWISFSIAGLIIIALIFIINVTNVDVDISSFSVTSMWIVVYLITAFYWFKNK